MKFISQGTDSKVYASTDRPSWLIGPGHDSPPFRQKGFERETILKSLFLFDRQFINQNNKFTILTEQKYIMNKVNVNNQSSTEMKIWWLYRKNSIMSFTLKTPRLPFPFASISIFVASLGWSPIAVGDALLSLVDLRRRGRRSGLESPRTANNRPGEIRSRFSFGFCTHLIMLGCCFNFRPVITPNSCLIYALSAPYLRLNRIRFTPKPRPIYA